MGFVNCNVYVNVVALCKKKKKKKKNVYTIQHVQTIRVCIPDRTSTLTLRLLISYIYGAPSKARNANVVYIWTYVWQR